MPSSKSYGKSLKQELEAIRDYLDRLHNATTLEKNCALVSRIVATYETPIIELRTKICTALEAWKRQRKLLNNSKDYSERESKFYLIHIYADLLTQDYKNKEQFASYVESLKEEEPSLYRKYYKSLHSSLVSELQNFPLDRYMNIIKRDNET